MNEIIHFESQAIQEILGRYPAKTRRYLIPMLQDTQDRFGYLSEEAIHQIADYLDISSAKVFGVATFYNQFRLTAPGRYVIRICRGTACHVKGSAHLLARLVQELGIPPGQTTRDGLFSIETVACIGACSIAPVMAVNDEFYGRLDPADIPSILNQYREKEVQS